MQEGTAPATATQTPQVEQVNIVFTKSDDQNGILVVPGKFFIRLNDQVRWKCVSPDGFSVDFNGANGSPFGTSHYVSTNGFILSGPAVNLGTFKYTVTVDGNVLDPTGVVDR